MADIDADELERALDLVGGYVPYAGSMSESEWQAHASALTLAMVAARAYLASLRTKADSGRVVGTEEQAAIRAALTNLLAACHKIPMARMTPFGYECPHCDAKAGESCRPKCWWPTIEAAITDGQEALKAAKERGNG